MKALLFASALACALPASGLADLVVATSPTNTFGLTILGGSGNAALEVSWSQSLTFTDVSVSVQVASFDPSFTVGTAFLTTEIGPGANPSSLVASTAFTAPVVPPNGNPTSIPPTQLFSGLTLGSGTYYLVLTAPSTASENSMLGWEATRGFSTGNGVSHSPGYGGANGANRDLIYKAIV